MGIKDIFKKIFEIFFKPSDFNNSGEYKVSFFSNNKVIELKQINNTTNIIIDLEKLNKEQKEKLIGIYPQIRENNGLILENKKYEIFKEYKQEIINFPTLKFFKGKIKEDDYQALRIAVYIKKRFDENQEVEEFLDDLYKKYGKRGNNINNLYGEGYFDNFIRLYYLALKEEEKENEFEDFFDKFVMEQPMTYFVSQNKSQEKMNQELFKKIEKNKKYGVKRLNIHGIGKDNLNKIKNFADLIEQNEDVKIVSKTEEGVRASLILEIIGERKT